MKEKEQDLFSKVKSKKMYMEIVDQILSLIQGKKLSLGERLPPERILAVKLGVSRPPLREAIAALEILGVIESRGGKGNFVANSKISNKKTPIIKILEKEVSPFELLEARILFETEAVGLAAEKADDEDLARIKAIIEEHEHAISDYSKAMELDMEFHLALVKATRNTVLVDIFLSNIASGLKNELWKKIKGETWSKGEHAQKYFAEHLEILKALCSHDREAAREAMRRHLRAIEADFLEEQD